MRRPPKVREPHNGVRGSVLRISVFRHSSGRSLSCPNNDLSLGKTPPSPTMPQVSIDHSCDHYVALHFSLTTPVVLFGASTPQGKAIQLPIVQCKMMTALSAAAMFGGPLGLIVEKALNLSGRSKWEGKGSPFTALVHKPKDPCRPSPMRARHPSDTASRGPLLRVAEATVQVPSSLSVAAAELVGKVRTAMLEDVVEFATRLEQASAVSFQEHSLDHIKATWKVRPVQVHVAIYCFKGLLDLKEHAEADIVVISNGALLASQAYVPFFVAGPHVILFVWIDGAPPPHRPHPQSPTPHG